MIYGFFCIVLAITVLYFNRRNRAALLAVQNESKLLDTNLKEAELRLKEINAETDLVVAELDGLRYDLEAEKEKLLISIGPKGKVIGELDKKIKDRQKELSDLDTKIKSKKANNNNATNIIANDAREIIEHLVSKVGLTDFGDALISFKYDRRMNRVLIWLVAEGYIHTFVKGNHNTVYYSLNPTKVKKSIKDFYESIDV